MKIRKDLKKLLEQGSLRADEYLFKELTAPPLANFMRMQDIAYLNKLATSVKYSAKLDFKYNEIDKVAEYYGFVRIGRGTNRAVYRHLENSIVCLKVAIDAVGIRDNPREYINQDYLYPFVCKIFEVDPTGTVALVERDNPITNREEFKSIAPKVYDLLRFWFTGKYVMEDIGTNYFMNWGTRIYDGCPILHDYPYMFELDYRKIYCKAEDPITGICGGEIDYDDGYNQLVCSKCGATYRAIDLAKQIEKRIIEVDDTNTKEERRMKITLVMNDGSTKIVDTNNANQTKSVVESRYDTAAEETKEASKEITSSINLKSLDMKPKAPIKSKMSSLADNIKVKLVQMDEESDEEVEETVAEETTDDKIEPLPEVSEEPEPEEKGETFYLKGLFKDNLAVAPKEQVVEDDLVKDISVKVVDEDTEDSEDEAEDTEEAEDVEDEEAVEDEDDEEEEEDNDRRLDLSGCTVELEPKEDSGITLIPAEKMPDLADFNSNPLSVQGEFIPPITDEEGTKIQEEQEEGTTVAEDSDLDKESVWSNTGDGEEGRTAEEVSEEEEEQEVTRKDVSLEQLEGFAQNAQDETAEEDKEEDEVDEEDALYPKCTINGIDGLFLDGLTIDPISVEQEGCFVYELAGNEEEPNGLCVLYKNKAPDEYFAATVVLKSDIDFEGAGTIDISPNNMTIWDEDISFADFLEGANVDVEPVQS